jgi:hypothetical protein
LLTVLPLLVYVRLAAVEVSLEEVLPPPAALPEPPLLMKALPALELFWSNAAHYKQECSCRLSRKPSR